MDAIEKFFESEAFFPVLVILLALLVLTLLWITLSNRKHRRNMVPQNSVVDDSSSIKIITDNNEVSQNQPLSKDLPTYTMANEQNEVPQTEVQQVSEPEVSSPNVLIESEPVQEVINSEPSNELPLVDIPVPEINESPVELNIPNATENIVESGSEIQIDNTETPVVENVNPEEIVNIDVEQAPVVEEVKQDEVVNIEPIPMDEGVNDAFAVTLNEVQALTQDVEEAVDITAPIVPEMAFGDMPIGDTSINENIEFEMPNEYTNEKTEVFEFPNFGNEIKNIEADTAKGLAASQSIEGDVIEAANRYIRSVMSK